eukprot:TRINITY_DN372_c0_g2_i1.p1 TRINITY_DN372_c0_g2~~TRINITY_DN372_c0_g2_i1.p1  ORF type:complete len:220 (+),score=36.08 TRINITY_DN372_c0_g2_i1:70-660(+)
MMARTAILLTIAAIEAPGALGASFLGSGGRNAVPNDLSCYMVADPAMESGGAKGRSYRGLVSSTVSGRTCQKWTEIHPWAEAATFKPVADTKDGESTTWGNGIGNHNYCRNPDSSKEKPWCFTMDTNEDHKVELCEIPACPEHERDFTSEAGDLAVSIGSKDCKCAEQLYGSTETTADTSVPLTLAQQQKKPCSCR